MKQITPNAPKIKLLKPKSKPPSLILNEKSYEEDEDEEEYFLIDMDEIDTTINERKISEDENENKNTLMYINEFHKDRLDLIRNSIKFKLSLYQQKNTDTSFDMECSD